MRLSEQHVEAIRSVVREEAGPDAEVSVFGSRLRDDVRGGDVDLLVYLPYSVENPAWLSALMSARISRRLGGRSVDVVLSAPNLKNLPIHEAARREGVRL